jgi:hypothetical protein
MRTRMNKLALLISLLALGTLGLVACGGDDDEDSATEAKASADTTTATARPDTTTEAKVSDSTPEGRLSREPVQELKAKLSREQVQELKREANEWARLFSRTRLYSRGGVCNKYTGQPICVGLSGSGPGVEVHATRVSAAYRTSFAGATVEDIKSVRILHVGWSDHPVSYAAVKFSNGEVVVFNGGGEWYSCAGGGSGCAWSIAEPDQNRRFLEAAAPRDG